MWSSVLILVTREWRYCGLVYKSFRINNIELKCSFVRCRKYHNSWSNGAAGLHISVDLLCGTMAAKLHNSADLLWDTTAAELHNSVDLLCGTTAAELNPVWCMKGPFNSQEKLKTMLKQNCGVTSKEHYGILWYFLEWSMKICHAAPHRFSDVLNEQLIRLWTS